MKKIFPSKDFNIRYEGVYLNLNTNYKINFSQKEEQKMRELGWKKNKKIKLIDPKTSEWKIFFPVKQEEYKSKKIEFK